MATVLLVRHGLTALTGPVLAGWTPGVHLDERGRAQAERLAERLAGVRLAAVVSSPLERCQDTLAPLATRTGAQVHLDERLAECRYGDWTGRELKSLVREPLWKVVQAHPSAVTFPGPQGESMAAMSARAVAAVRDWDARLAPEEVWLACSHGDVIKAVLADALGLHLDSFQRISVDPCSVSVVRYTGTRPFLVRANDTGTELATLVPARRRRRRGAIPDGDAALGGGAGPGTVG